jgi:hypothetical protein
VEQVYQAVTGLSSPVGFALTVKSSGPAWISREVVPDRVGGNCKDRRTNNNSGKTFRRLLFGLGNCDFYFPTVNRLRVSSHFRAIDSMTVPGLALSPSAESSAKPYS